MSHLRAKVENGRLIVDEPTTLPTTPEADAQIRTIDTWWRTNRPAAPDLFAEELANCFVLLEWAPKIGRPYSRHPSVQGLRRVLLRATRYHVY